MHVLVKVKQSSQQSSRKKSWQSGEHHTAVPSARRLAAAAPVANTRGSTPKIKAAKEVIITHHGGRKEALDQGLKEKSLVRLLAKTGDGQLLGNLFRFKSTEWFPLPFHRQYY